MYAGFALFTSVSCVKPWDWVLLFQLLRVSIILGQLVPVLFPHGANQILCYNNHQRKQIHPLKGIQTGRGLCNTQAIDNSSEACGGPARGRCSPGRECECFVGWTGPHCLSHQGFDPILYDQPDKISDLGFIPPIVAPTTLVVGLCALAFSMAILLQWRHRFDGWTPIPDGPKERILSYSQSD
jgi:EGF-like domain